MEQSQGPYYCLQKLLRYMLVIVTTFATTTGMFGNRSRQTQHLSNCRAARLSWKSLILAISSGLSN